VVARSAELTKYCRAAPLPPNLGLIAVTQIAIGTSVLWMWLGVMSVIGLYRVKSKGKGASSEPVLSWGFIKDGLRSLSRTLRILVVYGQAIGLLSVIVVSLAVFFTVIMQVWMGDTAETLGWGTYSMFEYRLAIRPFLLTIASVHWVA
jgi:hypothetical protein